MKLDEEINIDDEEINIDEDTRKFLAYFLISNFPELKKNYNWVNYFENLEKQTKIATEMKLEVGIFDFNKMLDRVSSIYWKCQEDKQNKQGERNAKTK